MNRKRDMVFCLGFVLLLLLPVLFTNIKTEQISEIDNAYLPEINWNEPKSVSERASEVKEWFSKRIGFRAESLFLYQQINDKLFHILDHPSYMYGKNGWIFSRHFFANHQHLNLNQKWAEGFADWMKQFEAIADSYGADFYYMLIPDKETVYPEYYPDGYNIRGSVSLTDQIAEEMSKKEVNFFYAYEAMESAKEDMLVANKMYDAEHWNENGAFVSIQAMIDLIREKYPMIPALTAGEFEIGTRHVNSLLTSWFPIDEDVPYYELKNMPDEIGFDDVDLSSFQVDFIYQTHYLNHKGSNLPKLLVFTDSYMMGKEKFVVSHFSEVTFIHRNNVTGPKHFAAWLEALRPDIVIFSNPERVLPLNFNKDE